MPDTVSAGALPALRAYRSGVGNGHACSKLVNVQSPLHGVSGTRGIISKPEPCNGYLVCRPAGNRRSSRRSAKRGNCHSRSLGLMGVPNHQHRCGSHQTTGTGEVPHLTG